MLWEVSGLDKWIRIQILHNPWVLFDLFSLTSLTSSNICAYLLQCPFYYYWYFLNFEFQRFDILQLEYMENNTSDYLLTSNDNKKSIYAFPSQAKIRTQFCEYFILNNLEWSAITILSFILLLASTSSSLVYQSNNCIY